jgi:molybdenum cofactor synthesis domain-containing protein
MPNPTAAMLVIGDEILSGRTRDSNMHHLAQELTKVGIDLREVRVVSDDAPAIEAALLALSGAYTHVFTSGGIGPTHDDITADCVARAFGRHIDVREDARALLAAHYARTGAELNAARLRMARIPDGATLIENPVSTAPGEGESAAPWAELAGEFSDLSIGSYPFQQNGAYGANIVIRGSDGARVDAAMTKLAGIFPS